MECPFHAGNEAITACVQCETPICPMCASETNQVHLCMNCYRARVGELSAGLSGASERLAKELIKEYAETGASPRLLVEERGLGLMRVEELRPVVAAVIAEYPRAAEDYASGRVKAVEFLLGQVLRRVEARARPEQVRSLLLEELDKHGQCLGSSVGRAPDC